MRYGMHTWKRSRGRGLRVLLPLALALLAAALWSDAAAAAPWCGAVSTTDRPAVLGGHVIRVLYATPSDGVDRSVELAPRIAAEADEIDAWWRREDSARTPRFDRYADPCGTQLDLGFLRLAHITIGLTDNRQLFSAIADEIEDLAGASHTKYLVYYDGPATERVCGTGGGLQDGVGLAVVFLNTCTGLGSTAHVAVHELLHSFGLARGIAPPHACPSDPGHVCDSTGDVLYTYAQPVPLSSFVLDVGRDDYYLHGSDRWDLATSPWLVRVNEQVALTVNVTGTGTVRSDLPGLACADGSCTTSWNPNTDVTLDAEPGEGQRFVRWGGACAGEVDCRLATVNGTVTALFAPLTYRLAVSVVGRGSVRSNPTSIYSKPLRSWSGAFTSYEPVKLVAKPVKGWRFRGWAGSARGTQLTASVPMSRNAAVRAVFVKLPAKKR
jgi:List-Bact-rpt repeat protein